MHKIPRKYFHYVFGAAQSAITCAIAAAIASAPFTSSGTFLSHWAGAYVYSWIVMLPVVVIIAPALRKMVCAVTD